MKELTIKASNESLEAVLAVVDEELEASGCPMKTRMQIDVAVEEIFVNIASYAYAQGTGMARVRVELSKDPAMVTITFADQGIPYDPLGRSDPDLTLPAEERPIGGLGIYIVKKTMDEVIYEYRDNQNILVIKKKL